MYTPYREETGIKFNIPWDKNTARGWIISVAILLSLLPFLYFVEIEKPKKLESEINKVPIDLLQISFGDGDGTGMSKGNLTAEGEMHKGTSPATNLSDAESAGGTQLSPNSAVDNPEDYQRFSPTKDIASNSSGSVDAQGTGSRNISSPSGSLLGTGLGSKGSGKGAGLGLGDIEWGGGGNRVVLNKRIPVYPPGAKGGQVKIRFVVDKNGTVISLRPAQKGGDPILERAAMQALREWKFNPLKQDMDMEGVITINFKLT